MKNIILAFAIICLFYSCSRDLPNSTEIGKIIFTWDVSPIDDRMGTVTETIENVTVSVTAPKSEHVRSVGYFDVLDRDNLVNGNAVISFHPESSITFEFSEPVHVESILAMSGDNQEIEYSFTSALSNNKSVTKMLKRGTDLAHATVFLNWENVTSFTVNSSVPTLFGFDFLAVIKPTEP